MRARRVAFRRQRTRKTLQRGTFGYPCEVRSSSSTCKNVDGRHVISPLCGARPREITFCGCTADVRYIIIFRPRPILLCGTSANKTRVHDDVVLINFTIRSRCRRYDTPADGRGGGVAIALLDGSRVREFIIRLVFAMPIKSRRKYLVSVRRTSVIDGRQSCAPV